MQIHISIDNAEPLTGTANAGTRAPVAFAGWLELLRAISELVGADGRHDDQHRAPIDQPTERLSALVPS
jgi:hypothetical protein